MGHFLFDRISHRLTKMTCEPAKFTAMPNLWSHYGKCFFFLNFLLFLRYLLLVVEWEGKVRPGIYESSGFFSTYFNYGLAV